MKNNYKSRTIHYGNEAPTINKCPKLSYRIFLFFLTFLAIGIPKVAEAGSINMTNGTIITTCSDDFYDSNGPFGYYNDNEHKIMTIYPATPGAKVTIDFTYFDIEDSYDYLYLYDGNSTSASYIGSYTGTSGPGTITSTAADGSLTIEFYSDAYVTNPGWEATVSCGTLSACSGSITAGTALSSGTTLCPGEPLTLTLSGFTAASGITYQWQSSTSGTGGWSNITGATTMPYTFVPAAGTMYYRCITTCTSSSSTSTSSTVTTTVGGSALPYVEDFESTSAGSFPSCTYATYATPWGDGMEVRDYGSYPSLDNHTPGGSNYLFAGYCVGYCYGTPDYFFTPGFSLSTGKTYQFSYWYNTDGYGGLFTTGAYIGPNQDPSSLTGAIAPEVYTSTTTYQQYIANFTVGANATYYIGIKMQCTGYYGMVIDDIGLMELPPCTGTPAYAGKAKLSPAMVCSSPGTATLSVSGTPPVSGLTFQWYEASTLAGPYTLITGATSNPYIRTGITSSKFYFCQVGCSAGGGTKNTDTVNIKIAPLTPPYVEDFETGTMGTNMPCASYSGSWDAYSYWYLYDGAHPYSWITLGNHTPGGSKWLFAGGGLGYYSGEEFWFTPAINFTAGKAYNFSYWYLTDGYDTYTFGARVGSSQSASAMTTPVGTDLTSSTTTYTKYSGDFVAGSTGAQYIGIKFKTNNWYYGCAIDDIGLSQLPPCSAKPTAGTAKATPSAICAAGGGSTTLSLVGLSAASDLTYQWQVSITGSAGTYTNIVGATTPSYTTGTITVPSCFRCVVTCPLIGAPNSDISAPVCLSVGPITPPYIETFESATAGVNQPCASYTTGWEASTGTGSYTYWGIKDKPGTSFSSVANHTAGGSKYLSAGYMLSSYYIGSSSDQQYWFSPGLSLTAGMAYKCNYWYVTSGYSYLPATTFGLYYGTSQTASAMTAMCPDATGETNTSYKEIVGSFSAPTTGTYYLGIKVNNGYAYYGVAIDDIGVEQLPLCAAKPSAGSVKASPTLICSSGTAKLSLVGTSMASKLTYQWLESTTGPGGPWVAAIGGSGATTSVYTTPTLSTTRWYKCVVTCPLIGAPNSDTTLVYTMNVGAITPPYRETFEASTPGTNVPCAGATTWGSSAYFYTTGSTYATGYTDLINHTTGGSKFLIAGYGVTLYTGGRDFWFTPAINLTAGATYEFSYWYLPDNYPYSGISFQTGLSVGTTQSRTGMTTTLIPDFTTTNSMYQQAVANFTPPTSGNYYFGIYARGNYGYGMAIDDIGIDQLPPCSGKPTSGGVASVVPAMLCSAGTAKLNLTALPKVANLSYEWWECTAAGVPTVSVSAALASPSFTTATLTTTKYYRCIVKCTLGSATDTTYSTVVKIDVGAVEPPYIETFETGTPGVNMPCASYSGSSFGAYYYWNLMSAPMTYSSSVLENHTTGGTKYLIGGYYIGNPPYSGGAATDYWFTPAIKFTSGKLYQLSYWYQTDGYSGCTYTLGAYMGSSQTPAAMTTAIGSTFTATNTTYKLFKQQFTAATTGNFYIGISKASAGFGYGVAIDDIGLQEVPPCSAPVVAGTIYADPKHICAAGGTTVLDVMGSTLATGLTYEWLSSTSPTGPFVTTGGTALPYTTDPLSTTTWFKVAIKCAASGATDTSTAFKVGVGGFDLPYVEDFETTPAGTVPLCSDATKWGPYYYNGWLVYGATITENYKNHTPGGKNFLIGGYYLGSPSSTSEDNYWFTPGLNMRSGYKYNLSFYHLCKVSWASIGNKIGVYFGKTQSVGGMTTNLIPYREFKNTSYELYDTTFAMTSGGVYYFGFRKSGSAPTSDYGYYGAAFDDINLNYAPCDGLPFAGNITSSKPSGTQYCVGTPLTLTDIGATISLVPGIKYQWQRKSLTTTTPWSNVVGATDTVISADTLIGYEYRLAVICGNTNDTAWTPTFFVPQLPPHPPVTIAPAISPVTYCLGDTVRFNATNYPGALYDWMLDSSVVFGWKFSDMGATDPGTYMVKVTSALSPCPAYSNQVKLIVNDPGYTAEITAPTDSIICAGSSLLLTGVASKPGVTYQWRKDNVPIPGATSNTYLVTTTGYYRFTADDGISSCAAVSRNLLITVKPNPPAIITVPGGTTTACADIGVRLDANLGGYSYQWQRAGSTIFGWSDSSQIITNSGTYTVKVRTADGCVTTSAPVTVNILPSPTPIISRSGYVLSVTPTTYVSYQWIRNGKDITDEPGTGPTFTMTKKGVYQIRVTDANGCKGISTPIDAQDNELNINNPKVVNDAIKIYPNPTNGLVFIESPINLNIEVKDVAGKTILEVKSAKEIDLSKYADGIYIFIIRDKDELIKQQRVTKTSR